MQSSTDVSGSGESAATHAFACAVVAACLIVKLSVLLLDDRVRLFMGDSATYLWSAVSLQVPPDRSFTYPLLIRYTAGASDSIMTLIWFQSLCGVAKSMMVYGLLRANRFQCGHGSLPSLHCSSHSIRPSFFTSAW